MIKNNKFCFLRLKNSTKNFTGYFKVCLKRAAVYCKYNNVEKWLLLVALVKLIAKSTFQ